MTDTTTAVQHLDSLQRAIYEALETLADTVNAMREQAARDGRRYCMEADALRPVYEPLARAFWRTLGGGKTTPLPWPQWGELGRKYSAHDIASEGDEIPFAGSRDD